MFQPSDTSARALLHRPLSDEGVVEGTLVYSLTELPARFSKNPIIFYN